MVCDPPAGIKFMGKDWDSDKGGRVMWVRWLSLIMLQCWRALKPGAHILVWALPRTSHWTATGIEEGSFIVRDVVTHHFGTGFPKSLDLGNGKGTALKPATEHWILARKEPDGSISNNVCVHGTGGLNIDACRVAEDRWPANLILSHSPGCTRTHMHMTRSRPMGAFTFGSSNKGYETVIDKEFWICVDGCPVKMMEEQGGLGTSEFFYVVKPDRTERDLGCDHLPFRMGGELTNRQEGSAGLANPRAGAGRTSGGRNMHPTCKSIGLMRYLCKMVTPHGGSILDPFTGSGSTGCAALLEGYSFLGMDLEADHCEIARSRVSYISRQVAREHQGPG
jgi:site-specific DNA-methyltransferase (adenine-specific)